MSARIDSGVAMVRPMTIAALDGVLELENEVYLFPWTRGNFVDSLVAGYTAWTLNHVDGDLIGYIAEGDQRRRRERQGPGHGAAIRRGRSDGSRSHASMIACDRHAIGAGPRR